MKIKINHIAKTEGHLSFEGELMKGNIAKAKIITEEGMRLIEGMLVGRKYYEAPIITARICGICPVVHNLSTIKAIENAFGIDANEETNALRKLLEHAQVIHSHALHLYFLSYPDFLQIPNDLTVIGKTPAMAGSALKIRDFGVKIVEKVGGRTVHVISSRIGGFRALPSGKEFKELFEMAESVLGDAWKMAEFFRKLKYPKFERKTIYTSLSSDKEYAIYDGKMSADGKKMTLQKFMDEFVKEFEFKGEAVKRTKIAGISHMAGALARINNNFGKLRPEAKKEWRKFNGRLPDYNSFHNIFAQAVELLHCVLEARDILKVFAKSPAVADWREPKIRAGEGYGAVEAPRGTLFDYYKVSKDGTILECNIITPTAQFLSNLEDDLKIYLPQIKNISEANRDWEIKKLIRAYDPCIACATH
jgi:coenzyme F420-reducing hydrogenase alpha subunit